MAAQEKFDLIIRAQDQASATIRNINGEVNRLATGAVPNVVRGADNMAVAFTRADLKAALLGSRLAGINPIMGQFANVLAFGNPLVGALSVGIGVLTGMFIDGLKPAEDYTAALTLSNEALAKLAAATGTAAESAKRLKEERLANLKGEEQSLQLQLENIKTTNEWDAVIGQSAVTLADSMMVRARVRGENEKALALEVQLNARLAENRKQQSELTSVDTAAADALAKLNEETRKLIALQNLRNIGGFGNITTFEQGDAIQSAEEALRRQQALLASGNAFGNLESGPMSMQWQKDEEDAKAAIDAVLAHYQEFQGLVMSSTDQLATGITDMFFGLRDSLADVFKGMAQNWVKYFINEIIKQTAAKLGFALFNVIFPGSGAVLGGAVGAGDIAIPGIMGKAGGTGIDLASAGAKRFAGPTSAGASVVVNINGPILGEAEHIQKKVIPVIEQAIRYQTTTIAGR
jgi:hypothetical protein